MLVALALVAGLLCAVTPTASQRHYSKCGGCNPRITKIDVFRACRFNTKWKCCDDFVKQDKWCWRKTCGGCGNGVLGKDEPCSEIVVSWKSEEKKLSLSRIQRCCKTHHLHKGSCKKIVDFPCGIARPKPKEINTFQKRVIKGRDAYYGQFPWQVSIHKGWTHYKVTCGGTLISKTKVLTAAHCQYKDIPNKINHTEFVMRIGNHDRKKNEIWQKRYRLKSITEYPGFVQNGYKEHDLAIWTLRDAVTLSSFRVPACLPVDDNADYVGKLVNISGWGRYKDYRLGNYINESYPDILQHGLMEVIPFQNCSNRQLYQNLTQNFQGLCVKYNKYNHPKYVSACHGDSGGGLMLYDKGKDRYTVIGVFSFGPPKCHYKIPSVFASLTGEHLQWIKKEMEMDLNRT